MQSYNSKSKCQYTKQPLIVALAKQNKLGIYAIFSFCFIWYYLLFICYLMLMLLEINHAMVLGEIFNIPILIYSYFKNYFVKFGRYSRLHLIMFGLRQFLVYFRNLLWWSLTRIEWTKISSSVGNKNRSRYKTER